MSEQLAVLLIESGIETMYMVGVSSLIALVFGLPLGLILAYGSDPEMLHCPNTRRAIEIISNILRSIPFIILIIALIPLTRLIVGSAIGTNAAIVPLSIGAIPLMARLIENVCSELPRGLIEAGIAIGATPRQTIRYIVFPEALPGFINAFTLTVITLIGYSAMAGAVGAGGLGNLAISYGYQRFNTSITYATVIMLIVLVQIIQLIGNKLARKFTH